ncbi:hypothetical protein EV03_0468 [Prochlorococcus marinus str. PAC1]|uniref:Uncharacterized protein n=1 Tax=Prochlorococcus marinus str. PAC1 TaxID=59924 RepID=A0A0A2CAV3_PROMR|nr:hypothetical protein EV03_0468 [Prochlorococcus marinus str. PAC1]
MSEGINSLPIKPVHPVSSNFMISLFRFDKLRGILITYGVDPLRIFALWNLQLINDTIFIILFEMLFFIEIFESSH